MKAKKCDRCNKFYEYNKFKYKGKNIVDGMCFTAYGTAFTHSMIDLCDGCLESLCEWLNNCESEVDENETQRS